MWKAIFSICWHCKTVRMMEREFGGVLVWLVDMSNQTFIDFVLVASYYSKPPQPNFHRFCTSGILLIRSDWILGALVLVLWGDFVTFAINSKPRKHRYFSGAFISCPTFWHSHVLFDTLSIRAGKSNTWPTFSTFSDTWVEIPTCEFPTCNSDKWGQF